MQWWTSFSRLPLPKWAQSRTFGLWRSKQQWQFSRPPLRSYGTALREDHGDDTRHPARFVPYRPFKDVKHVSSPAIHTAAPIKFDQHGALAAPLESISAPQRPDAAKRILRRRNNDHPQRQQRARIIRGARRRIAWLRASRGRSFLLRLRMSRRRTLMVPRRRRVRCSPSSVYLPPTISALVYKPRFTAGATAPRTLNIWSRHHTKISTNLIPFSKNERPPIVDVRTVEWIQHCFLQLYNGQLYLHQDDLFLAQDKDASYVWMEISIWLQFHKPRSMPRFLEATHVEPYIPASYIQDALLYLARQWWTSEALDRLNQLQQLADTFCVLANRGTGKQLTFDHLEFINPFFRILVRSCSDDRILKCYEAIKSYKVSIHWYSYCFFAEYFAKNNHFEMALEALKKAREAGVPLHSYAFLSNCSTILRRSSEQRDGLRVCLRIVSELVDMGVRLNRPICDIIMLNAVEAGDLKTAFSVYHSLVERGLIPAESTFAVLLKGCKMNIDDAEMLNNVIRDAIAHVNVRKSELVASEILHCLKMHHSKHNPTTTLNTLTEAYAQLFDIKPLQKLGLPIPKMNQAPGDYMLPSRHAMNFMIAASIEHVLINRSYSDGVLPLYERWRKHVEAGDPSLAALATEAATANIFLMAFIKRSSGLIHAARVMRDMQKPLPASAGVEQTPPTVQSWSIFLHGFSLHGKNDLAEQVLNYMRSKGMQPNAVTWNTLMTGYARAQNEEGTLDAVRRARQSGMEWTEWTYGGLRGLKRRKRLEEELAKGRLERSLDMTSEIKQRLSERLKNVEITGDEDRASTIQKHEIVQEQAEERRHGFVDSPQEIAEEMHYRPL